MNESGYRVLIVDDDKPMRELLAFVLDQKGFRCEVAKDGQEAEQKVHLAAYDAVVTDLRMPNQNGHALAQQLLLLRPRPTVIIHTAVIEPKLAKDLLARGVDDILFKPFDLGILATKLRMLIESTRASRIGPEASQHAPRAAALVDQPAPVVRATCEVLNLVRGDRAQAREFAAAIRRDAAFAAKVLRLANCTIYNPAGQPVVELDQAVTLLGQRRIGEMALHIEAAFDSASEVRPVGEAIEPASHAVAP
jgi:DNA-binding response OmpR family regulator